MSFCPKCGGHDSKITKVVSMSCFFVRVTCQNCRYSKRVNKSYLYFPHDVFRIPEQLSLPF